MILVDDVRVAMDLVAMYDRKRFAAIMNNLPDFNRGKCVHEGFSHTWKEKM